MCAVIVVHPPVVRPDPSRVFGELAENISAMSSDFEEPFSGRFLGCPGDNDKEQINGT
jgi:hypothetical protein